MTGVTSHTGKITQKAASVDWKSFLFKLTNKISWNQYLKYL